MDFVELFLVIMANKMKVVSFSRSLASRKRRVRVAWAKALQKDEADNANCHGRINRDPQDCTGCALEDSVLSRRYIMNKARSDKNISGGKYNIA